MKFDVKRYALFVVAGLVGGTLSGLFGIGGGLVLTPILVFFFHFQQKRAQATSLVAIILTAISGAVPYAMSEPIDWLAVLLIVVGGVGGSLIGAALVQRINDNWLRIIFAAVAIVSAVKMIISAVGGAASAGGLETVSPATSVGVSVTYIIAGLAMGLLSALVGVGGGIILVPILSVFIGLAQVAAQGLSLVVMAPISAVGAARHARHGYTDWAAGIALGIGGAIMSPITAQLALNMPTTILPILFALLLVFTAGQLVYKTVKSWRAARNTAE